MISLHMLLVDMFLSISGILCYGGSQVGWHILDLLAGGSLQEFGWLLDGVSCFLLGSFVFRSLMIWTPKWGLSRYAGSSSSFPSEGFEGLGLTLLEVCLPESSNLGMKQRVHLSFLFMSVPPVKFPTSNASPICL